MSVIGSHRPERRKRLRTLRLVVSTSAFLAVVAGTLFIGHPIADVPAQGIAMAQFVPSLLRWRDVASVGAGAALFVAPLLIGATLLIGRGYCSSLCPLGTTQDLLMLLIRRPLRQRLRFRPPLPWLRAITLAAAVGLWIAGSSLLLGLLEPYALFHRGLLAFAGFISPGVNRALPAGAVPEATTIALIAAILSLLLLFAVLVAAALSGRVYCTTLCPAGSLLSVPARRSLLRIRLAPGRCTSCGLCERACPTGCIDSRRRTVHTGSCVLCFDCLAACPSGALRYGLKGRGEGSSGAGGRTRVRAASERPSVSS